jgi:hypothetical protein
VQVIKRNALPAFVVMPQRWIVERAFGWLEQSQRLWKPPERPLNTSLQFIHLAFLSLLLKRLRTASKTSGCVKPGPASGKRRLSSQQSPHFL